MKNHIKLFLPALMLCLFLQNLNLAWADDSGDERCVAVREWICWLCQKQFFTFAPDDVSYKTNVMHKDANYQQSNWIQLNKNSPIRKCEKAMDGAHVFYLKQDMMTAPYIIMERSADYIVLKNGSSIKSVFNQIQCVGCQKTALCFKGDDMDQWGILTLRQIHDVYSMSANRKIGNCDKMKMPSGMRVVPHFFVVTGERNLKSADIARSLSSILCSD